MNLTTKKIIVIATALGSLALIGSFFGGYLADEQSLSPERDGEIQTPIRKEELQVRGTEVGIAYTKYQERDPLLTVFPIGNPTEIVDTVTVEELRKFSNGPNFSIHEVIYDKNFGGFIIITEDLPYMGGSARNSSWSIIAYNEDDRTLRFVLEDDGGGSFVPSDLTFSPSGTKLAYTSGIRAGGCAASEYLEGIDIQSFQPFVFQGEVVRLSRGQKESQRMWHNLLGSITLAAGPNYRERERSPINEIPNTYFMAEKTSRILFSFSELKWENDETISGKYAVTICEPELDENYQTIIRKEITQDFKVTISQ